MKRRLKVRSHFRISPGLLLLLAAAWELQVLAPMPLVTYAFTDEVRDHIRSYLRMENGTQVTVLANTRLTSLEVLRPFYAQRHYEPAWSRATGPSPQIEAFLTLLDRAPHEGLESEDYHAHAIRTLWATWRQHPTRTTPSASSTMAALDLVLSDAFFIYAAHLSRGQQPPAPHHAGGRPVQSPKELAGMLHEAVNTTSIVATLSTLRPPHPGYAALQQALAQYRHIATQGGWPILPDDLMLHQGDGGVSRVLLRLRLQATGDLVTQPTDDPTHFDEALVAAVRRFQRRHGLVADGKVGPATRTALQIPIEDRLRQLTRNLDRWRWLPHDLGARYILINIPAFTLNVVEHNRSVLTMRVVVGKPSWPTPVLRGLLSSVVLNPTWDIPSRIVQQEILPRIRRDPSYLTTHNIALIQGKGENATVIAPDTIDWSQAFFPHFPYRLHQRPGPTNPLGRMKFMLANPFQITLHDTPLRELFAEAMRAKSHGCIRLEKPLALAEYLLQADSRWTRMTLLDAIDRGEPQQVVLPVPIPVYLIYHTAWADADGRIHFRPDIYGWDTDFSPMPDHGQPAACG